MKAERRSGGDGALEGEALCQLPVREPHIATFQQRTVGAADRHVLRMAMAKCGVAARVEQAPRTQGKAAIAHVVPVGELRPRRADVVVSEEPRIPLRAVDYEPVPLNDEAMGR